MNVWLVKIGEPLPTKSDAGRPYRTGLLAQSLLARGHDVTWWSSTFNHFTKRHQFHESTTTRIGDHYQIVQIHGCAYQRNVSLARIWNHRQIARRFAVMAEERPRPDIIVSAFPTIELSLACVEYGRAHGVPVLLDVRDLWPDIFTEVVPGPLRWAARIALLPMENSKRRAFHAATGALGTSDAFVDWGVAAAGRPRGPRDRAFAHGYPSATLTAADRLRADAFWLDLFGGDVPRNLICFFGNFAEHVLDLDTVIDAASELVASKDDVTFVLCGIGASRDRLITRAAGVPRVWFPGRIGAAEIRVLMEHASAGLVPYVPRWDFEVSLPNKAIEYWSAGLPVISCLTGQLQTVLRDNRCGLSYKTGNSSQLADCIREVMTPAVQAVHRASAMALFETRFRSEVVYDAYAAHIEAMVRPAMIGPMSQQSGPQ